MEIRIGVSQSIKEIDLDLGDVDREIAALLGSSVRSFGGGRPPAAEQVQPASLDLRLGAEFSWQSLSCTIQRRAHREIGIGLRTWPGLSGGTRLSQQIFLLFGELAEVLLPF